jgi:hypothetical protein
VACSEARPRSPRLIASRIILSSYAKGVMPSGMLRHPLFVRDEGKQLDPDNSPASARSVG